MNGLDQRCFSRQVLCILSHKICMCQVHDVVGQDLSSNQAYIGYNLAAVGATVTIAALAATLLGVPPVWLSVVALIWLLMWTVAAGFLSDETTRHKLSTQLDAPNYTQLYTYLTNNAVSEIWKRLCDPVTCEGRWWPYLRAALTWRLYDRALLVALAYPILLLVGQWVVTGAEGRVGSFTTIPPSTAFFDRIATAMGPMILALFLFLSRRDYEGDADWIDRFVLLGTLFTGFFLLIASFPAVSAGMLVMFLVMVSFIQRQAIALAFVVFAFAIIQGINSQFDGIIGFIFALASGLFLFLFTKVIFFFAKGYFKANGGMKTIRFLTLFLILFCIVVVGALDWPKIPDFRRNIFLFLAVLPLLNAVFDVLSYAVTLSLIRRGMASPRPWFWGLADLGLACFLFLILGATLVAVVHGLNLLGGVHFIDLPALFGGIHDRPSDYIWLYLMLFSTVVPTGLHAGVALISLQGWCPRYFRRRLSRWINNAAQSPLYSIGASLGLGLVWGVPVAGAVFLIWLAVHFGWSFLLLMMQWYFDLLLWLAAIPFGAI